MSPQNSTPGLSLPQPTLETQSVVPAMPTDVQPQQAPVQQQVQHILATPPVQPTQMAPPVAPPMPVHNAPQQPVPLQATSTPGIPQPLQQLNAIVQGEQPTATPAPVQDDLDDDALDEEWVNKAKSIVEQNQADPFMESRALEKVKAEYLQRRYGKQIKVND